MTKRHNAYYKRYSPAGPNVYELDRAGRLLKDPPPDGAMLLDLGLLDTTDPEFEEWYARNEARLTFLHAAGLLKMSM